MPLHSKLRLVLFSLLLPSFVIRECSGCDPPWFQYKNGQCIQSFPSESLKSYAEAESFCKRAAGADLNPSLVLIKTGETQTFLESQIYKDEGMADSIWLGVTYNKVKGNFTWADGEEIGYSNWAPGHPRKGSGGHEKCVEIRSPHARTGARWWYEVACSKRNLVVCQKGLGWTSPKVLTELMSLRKEVSRIPKLEKQLSSLQTQIHENEKRMGKFEQVVSTCLTNIQLGPYQQTVIFRKRGFKDQAGFLLTSALNQNSDNFVDAIGRRQLRIQVNGTWRAVRSEGETS